MKLNCICIKEVKRFKQDMLVLMKSVTLISVNYAISNK